MKNIFNVRILKPVFLMAASSFVTPLAAHDMEGNLAAAAGEAATDLYAINCYNDLSGSQEPTHHLFAALRSNVVQGGPLSMVVYKKTDMGGVTMSATDAKGGDYTTSPDISLAGGGGEYLIFVHHVSDTPQTYLLQYHCQDAQNQHTGTDIQTLQNQ